MATRLLGFTVFAASGVGMVEALTIVIATGVMRGWRSALPGASAAIYVLIMVVDIFGTTLATKAPLQLLLIGLALFLVGGYALGTAWLTLAIVVFAPALDDESIRAFLRRIGPLNS